MRFSESREGARDLEGGCEGVLWEPQDPVSWPALRGTAGRPRSGRPPPPAAGPGGVMEKNTTTRHEISIYNGSGYNPTAPGRRALGHPLAATLHRNSPQIRYLENRYLVY